MKSSPQGSGTWPVERRWRRDGGPDVEAVGCVMANAFCQLVVRACLVLYFTAKITGCATEERAELVNVRLLADLHLEGDDVRDGRGASGYKAVADEYNLGDSPRLEPVAHVGCCKEMRQGRSRRL
eukprot:6212518-Pleurochrysis_carterae.AAC.5